MNIHRWIVLYTVQEQLNGTERRLASGSRAGRRRLMDTEVADGQTFMFVNVSNCLYFYVENVTFTLYGNSWQLPFNPRVNESSYCANYSATYVVSFVLHERLNRDMSHY
jgi:hypothetical protein